MIYSKLLTVVVLLFLAGCAIDDSTPTPPIESTEADAWASEFRGLRKIKGQFEGGTWNDDIDEWMGRKHQLMINLGSHFGTGEYSETEVFLLLGPPDLIAGQGDELFELINNLPDFKQPAAGDYRFLIYYWRGAHDFLYFTSQDGHILNSGWWYAGE